MKKIILTLLLMASASAMFADDYKYMAFRTNDGNVNYIGLSDLKITFVDGKLVAVAGEENQTISLADLTMMYFTTTTAISQVEENNDAKDGVEVYNMQGIKVADNLNSLGKGVYIVKKQGKAQKISIK